MNQTAWAGNVQQSPSRLWTFANCEFDELGRKLRVNGNSIELEPKPMEVLLYLLHHPGEVASKETLLETVWPGLMVVDGSLATAVSKLRKAIGDDDSIIVQTVPRVGYRLGVPVRARSAAGAGALERIEPSTDRVGDEVPSAKNRTWRVAAISVALILIAVAATLSWTYFSARNAAPAGAQITSIAVLPLVNMSADPTQDFLADGMTEELITELSQVHALRVISRTTVMQYKSARKPLPEIARQLRVDLVLEGSVLRSGNRVRVTAQLIQAASDSHLWAESYDRDVQDILNLQKELAHQITREIRVTLSPSEEKQLTTTATVNPHAHELYLEGRYFWNQRTKEALNKAAGFFQQSIAADPNYAQAYAGLADTYVELVGFGNIDPVKGISEARAAAEKAIALNDSAAEPHAALGYLIAAGWDWKDSEKEFQKALEINPGYNVALYQSAFLQSLYGHHDEAIRLARKALDTDPLSPIVLYRAGRVEFHARHYDEAVQLFSRILELNPNDPLGSYGLGLASQAQGNHEQAIAYFQRENLNHGLDVASAKASEGRKDEARRDLAAILETTKKQNVYLRPGLVAEVFASLGDKDEAMRWLEKGFKERDAWLALLKVWPAFDPLRSDPRFQDLLKRMQFPE